MALGSGGSGGNAGGIRAGAAFVELYVKNGLLGGLNQAAKDLKNFGNVIGGIGLKLTAIGGAALSPLLAAAGTLNDLSKQGSIAKAFDLSPEQFTGIAGIAKSVGEDTREFTESLVTMGKVVSEGFAGKGEVAADFFNKIGLSAADLIKLKPDEQFYRIFEALSKVEDPLTRVRLMMVAFGEDGGKYLLPLLGKSGDELRKMAAGFAVSTADMEKATAAASAYSSASNSISTAWRSIAVAVAPVVKMIAEGIQRAATEVGAFVEKNREVVIGAALAAGGIAAVGTGLITVGLAAKVAGVALSGLAIAGNLVLATVGAIATLLMSPVFAGGLLLAGIVDEFVDLRKVGGEAFQAVANGVEFMFSDTWDNLKQGWSGVVAAIQKGDLTLAFEIGSKAIQVEWVRFTNFLDATWNEVKNIIIEGLDEIEKRLKNAVDLERQLMGLDGLAVLEQKPAFLKQTAGQSPTDIRNAKLAAAQAALAAAMAGLDDSAWDFGYKDDFGAGFKGGGLAGQIAGNAMKSLGAFGGSANVGMFGQGGDIGKKIADNTKETADGVKKLTGIMSSRHDEKMGQLTVEGGT